MIDRKKRKRTPRVLRAKSRVSAKAVRTPAVVARQLERLWYAHLQLEDRVADLERRTRNLEIVVRQIRRWQIKMTGVWRLPPKVQPPPVLDDLC